MYQSKSKHWHFNKKYFGEYGIHHFITEKNKEGSFLLLVVVLLLRMDRGMFFLDNQEANSFLYKRQAFPGYECGLVIGGG